MSIKIKAKPMLQEKSDSQIIKEALDSKQTVLVKEKEKNTFMIARRYSIDSENSAILPYPDKSKAYCTWENSANLIIGSDFKIDLLEFFSVLLT